MVYFLPGSLNEQSPERAVPRLSTVTPRLTPLSSLLSPLHSCPRPALPSGSTPPLHPDNCRCHPSAPSFSHPSSRPLAAIITTLPCYLSFFFVVIAGARYTTRSMHQIPCLSPQPAQSAQTDPITQAALSMGHLEFWPGADEDAPVIDEFVRKLYK